MEAFLKLGVDPFFSDKLKQRFIEKPTAIQNLVIPRLLEGKSAVFCSATGTGKTFAYLLPILTQLIKNEEENNKNGELEFLIAAPTLELCSQIKVEMDYLLQSHKIRSSLLIGSVSLDRQIEKLKKERPSIVIGNPGRLLILAKMRKLRFSSLRFLVLDEADRLINRECIEETELLLANIERNVKHRDKLCLAACSATVDEKTRTQLGTLFESAEIITSEEHEILREKIEHWAIFSERRRKDQTLRSLLAALKDKKSRMKALIFTSRSDEAALVLSRLQHHNVSAAGLFGKAGKKQISNAERKTSLDSFREGRIQALVSTDLAARGLDIPGITHVIALDVPAESESYIHRCGRTGRAGKRGVMITIGDETQMHLLASMEKKLKIRVQPKELHYGKVCNITDNNDS